MEEGFFRCVALWHRVTELSHSVQQVHNRTNTGEWNDSVMHIANSGLTESMSDSNKQTNKHTHTHSHANTDGK